MAFLAEWNPVPEEVIHHIDEAIIVTGGISDTLSVIENTVERLNLFNSNSCTSTSTTLVVQASIFERANFVYLLVYGRISRLIVILHPPKIICWLMDLR